ncbi:hypothetical protein AVEN_214856-1 [Araneus ventricosus]|uniref:Retrovirus-related Pol polyprotein from transposon TNT 1-94 n=1 Tax=Araneus ventricosus TaxID=182803 RepID=A0A4Y2HJU0_ARAVE|nr:hypothetical protein AVEN_214856-1 [Araneus ventricosus]
MVKSILLVEEKRISRTESEDVTQEERALHTKNYQTQRRRKAREEVDKEARRRSRQKGDKVLQLRQLTVPESLQQNEVSERMNQTLINTTRCLLIKSGLGPKFWAEAVSTATYLRKKRPSAAISGSIPERIWSGK